MQQTAKNKKPVSLLDVLQKYEVTEKSGNIAHEFQYYGGLLARDMGEEKRKSLYIKLAKTEKRGLLEKARYFVLDVPNVRNKGKLFMWTLAKLKRGEPLKGQG